MTWIKKGVIFDKEWAQLPVVDFYPDFYKIYYSTRDEQGRSIPKCYILTKDLEWDVVPTQPNIPLGKPGSFDSHGIMPSSIITLEDGTKYMYYVGWSKRVDVPYWNQTGLAISKDNGVTWEKYSEKPVFQGDGGNWVGTVEVKYIGDKGDKYFIMFYSSCEWADIDGKQEPLYDIKKAYSNDGINWEGSDLIIGLSGNEGGIAAFRMVENNFHGFDFYASKRNESDYKTNKENSYKIYSFEEDEDGNITNLELEPTGDENMTAYPFVVCEQDRDIMFYNGKDFGKSGISYAVKYK